MVRNADLTDVLKTFVRTVVTDYSVEEMLESLCTDIARVLECDAAGVMLEDEAGDLRFVAASNDTVRHIEGLQIELREGPCLNAYRTGDITIIDDLTADGRFPRFSARARDVGMGSVWSFPLSSDQTCVGALNLYSKRAVPAREEDLETGKLLADVCTSYILNARTLADSYKLAGQLQRALDSRVVIEQAKGALAEQLGVNVNQAFEVLRSHARSNGRKLHDVAAEVVAGTLTLRSTG